MCKPPKQRNPDAPLLPRVAAGNADPPPSHRCVECRRPTRNCVRAYIGRETEQYVCRTCLETQGQVRLFPA